MATEFNPMTDSLQVSCSCIAEAPGAISIRYRIENSSMMTLYTFDSPRMPYILLQADGSLLVLHGVNPPDPDLDYYMIEIPITRPIQPGEAVDRQVSLTPLYLSDHYETQRTPTELHGAVKVHCHVGWGETPILASERHTLSITMVLAWQHIAQAEAIQIDLP